MVSVIIATYNYGRYISQALQSLVDQTYNNWECIVIDDGSEDNTAAVLAEWVKKDQRISYYFQKNTGPSVARNNGISKATGQYILFLDADDWFQKDKLKTHIAVFDKDPAIDIVYGDVRYFSDEHPGEVYYSLKPENKPWVVQLNGKGNIVSDVLMKQNIMAISSPLIKKGVLNRTGALDERIHRLEDWELFQRMALNDLYFSFVEAPDSFVMVRSHASSLNKNENGMRNYFLPILEKHLFKSKLSLKMRIYLLLRIPEEYTDRLFGFMINKNDPPKHYFSALSFLVPVAALIFLPFYFLIKIFRLFRT